MPIIPGRQERGVKAPNVCVERGSTSRWAGGGGGIICILVGEFSALSLCAPHLASLDFPGGDADRVRFDTSDEPPELSGGDAESPAEILLSSFPPHSMLMTRLLLLQRHQRWADETATQKSIMRGADGRPGLHPHGGRQGLRLSSRSSTKPMQFVQRFRVEGFRGVADKPVWVLARRRLICLCETESLHPP